MTDDLPFPPVFATNNPITGESVASEVNRMLSGLREELAQPPNLALATAYLNPQGFALIAGEVEKAPHVRILLGAEPDEPLQRRLLSGEIPSFEAIAAQYEAGLRRERDLVGFDAESDAAARALVKWLRYAEQGLPPRVEVKRYKKGFLHGKAFIAEHPRLPAVLAGSSNLTYAGLAVNRELNLGYPSGEYTGLVVRWFNDLWAEAEPYDLAAIYEARWSPHSPWVVFLKMLHALYGDDPDGSFERFELNVTEFQRDGITRAQRLLEELGGVLVCDEVGLGKTFIAGEIAKQVSERQRQRVLVVVPASLRSSTWLPFLKKYDISRRVEVVTFDDLRIGRKEEVKNLDDYALVIIDEAHNLRNPNTLRSEAVMSLLWGENPKKVVLLTATPVNNTLRDLQTLVSYFVRNDAQFAAQGITSISSYIKRAQDLDPDTLSPEHLFDLMDKVAVRRTRRFIKKEYPNETIIGLDGKPTTIEFPTPKVERLNYELDLDSDDIVARMIRALAVGDDEDLVVRAGHGRDPARLSLARYAPSVYLKSRAEGEEVGKLKLQITNVGLLRSGLLKRLESSTAALIGTLERLIQAHNAFIDGIDQGYVITGETLNEFASSETDDLNDFLDELDEVDQDQVRPSKLFEVTLLKRDVELDLALLKELLDRARQRQLLGVDNKVQVLLEYLESAAVEAQRPNKHGLSSSERRKVVVFSTFSDTVRDLHRQLEKQLGNVEKGSPLADYQRRLAPAVYGARGGSAQDERTATLTGFAPKTAGELRDDGTPVSEDKFDIIITTDVLAEGVNLQQAGRLINFDLPWNPMRLVQRHGRIDRIGSPHKEVLIGCFFPGEALDELLGLEETLQRKIAYANAAIGTGTVIPGQRANPDVEVLFHDTSQDIRSLYTEDATLLIEGGGSGALSGEEYRRRLYRALSDHNTRNDVESLPFGSGSGHISTRINQPGYVFCAKIGDHPTPWFRFIPVDRNTWRPRTNNDNEVPVVADTLRCLMAADPGDGEHQQVLDERQTTHVFEAWALARNDIHNEWSKLTDPANLQPQIPYTLRRAVELVLEHGSYLGPEQQTDLVARLNGKWEKSVVNVVRNIIRGESDNTREKIQKLQQFVKETGLPMPKPPEPLPPVSPDEIRVVCWMAVDVLAKQN